MKVLFSILRKKQIAIFIVAILVLAITFETLQQLYYIRRFDLSDEATFLGILKNQSYRWLIWMILSGFIITYVNRNVTQNGLSFATVIRYTILIISLVFLNILIISITQVFIGGFPLNFASLFVDNMPFFTFQKAPIYTLGYIAILVITHLYLINEQLQVEVQDLADLKRTNVELYDQLNKKIDDRASILNIKIGNKRKIIPVEDITWIEADDYCVKVHTTNEQTYSMRSTLKALNEKLDNNFMRVHRKAIVNMHMTKELDLSESPSLVLKDDMRIPVSKSYLKLVRSYLS
ncbi:LytTR family transcriptional regulator DNA-binding domain-containing protein [Winogradskyella sp. 3972H.M.0a.05]|uniref:LytR/AlgR family response regulator transcription factor n=1 Tax=Winogradskyella sp. 3972H.M.0a.05 TaxID=2950277 RepID=UPI003398E91F